tara:strand:- start:694 stop:2028 length:1335 start_codon:yes stop_codon:yes gene_type:complete
MRTLIKNAICILEDETLKTNILFDQQKILTCDAAKTTVADETIEANGLHLIPGLIDDQVHFREPGMTHKEDIFYGSAGCAKGGITTFLEMPNTIPSTTSNEALYAKINTASKNSLVNYGFFIGATNDNLKELQKATRTPGIKIFFGSSTGDLLVEDMDILESIFSETNLPIAGHCEDEAIIKNNFKKFKKEIEITSDVMLHSKIRDRKAAISSTEKITKLAKKTNKNMHVLHLSTKEEIEIIKNHQNLITAEACIPHLMFTLDDYDKLKTLVQGNPSVKTKEDQQALFDGLNQGVIQVIATDHAPHTLEEKMQRYPKSPSGMPSVENSLALMLNQVNKNKISLERVIKCMATNPAKLWNIPHKGKIKTDYHSDLVLVDLNKEKTIKNKDQITKCAWSPWDGQKITGWPEMVWVNGLRVFAEDKIDYSKRGKEVLFSEERKGFWN